MIEDHYPSEQAVGTKVVAVERKVQPGDRLTVVDAVCTGAVDGAVRAVVAGVGSVVAGVGSVDPSFRVAIAVFGPSAATGSDDIHAAVVVSVALSPSLGIEGIRVEIVVES